MTTADTIRMYVCTFMWQKATELIAQLLEFMVMHTQSIHHQPKTENRKTQTEILNSELATGNLLLPHMQIY